MEIKTSVCAPNYQFKTKFVGTFKEEVLDEPQPGAQLNELEVAVQDLEDVRSRDQSMDGKHPFCSGATDDTIMTNSHAVLDYAELFQSENGKPQTLGDVAYLASKREEVREARVEDAREQLYADEMARTSVLAGGTLISAAAVAVGLGAVARGVPFGGLLMLGGAMGALLTASQASEGSTFSQNVAESREKLDEEKIALEDTSVLMETAEAWNAYLAD